MDDITLDAALAESIKKIAGANATETIGIDEAQGRILREDITADIAVPPVNTAAVDGYAFRSNDAGKTLPVRGHITAGHPYDEKVEAGIAYRIFTGAAIPDGLDTVAMEEFCVAKDGKVTLPADIKPGANFRAIGENVAKGDGVLKSGTRMGASEIGLAASLGIKKITVAARLNVAVLSTGDEIIEAGGDSKTEHAINDSNRPMLARMLAGDCHGFIDGGIIRDDRDALSRAYTDAAGKADAVISTGGSSAGEEDHARPAILEAGGEVEFWRLAIKPGRPVALGRIGGIPVFCLPGNPVASFVCYRLIVAPVLAAMQGAATPPPLKLPVQSGFEHHSKQGRTEYLRARIADGKVFIHGRPGAGVLSSLTGADGLVEIPADMGEVKKGDVLGFIPFRESGL